MLRSSHKIFKILIFFHHPEAGGRFITTLPCPTANGIIISLGMMADTFLHIRLCWEIMFPGRKNRVWGGVLSLSTYRFECFGVQNSQGSAAK